MVIPDPTFTSTITGFKLGQTATTSGVISADPFPGTTAVQSSDVGDYTISATGGTATNYRFRYENNGKLTINKAELTVTTNSASREYGGANPTNHRYDYWL